MYIGKEVSRGYNPYIELDRDDFGTQMDVGLLIMEPGDVFQVDEAEKEVAALLFCGEADFGYAGEKHRATRADCFSANPWCLHVPAGVSFSIEAASHCEFYIQKTRNSERFEAKLYRPEDTIVQHAGSKGELMGCMRREIKTVFDLSNAPYSKMVVGEVLNYPGKWSSYPPHHHPQPEVYFYRFDYPQGFGVGFANGEVYKTGHNGLLVINSEFHSQAAAPGYAMCYVWGIRHLDGDPWDKTRIDDKEHEWLWKDDANEHIFKGE